MVDPICARAVGDAAELLRSLGHEVEEVDPPWQADGLSELFGAVFSSHIALSIAYSGMVAGPRADRRGHGADELGDLLDGRQKLNAVQGMGATVQLQAFARRLVAFLDPTTRCSRPRWPSARCRWAPSTRPRPSPMSTFTRSGLFTPFTPVFNASGQPGISLPLYQGEDGLPLGVQIVGRPAGEAALLALAAQLEEAPSRGPGGARRSREGVLD